MKTIKLKYCSFIVCITGKMNETIETEADTLQKLIEELGKEYEGFKEIYIPDKENNNELKAVVNLRRKGEAPAGIFDMDFKLKNEDLYFFW